MNRAMMSCATTSALNRYLRSMTIVLAGNILYGSIVAFTMVAVLYTRFCLDYQHQKEVYKFAKGPLLATVAFGIPSFLFSAIVWFDSALSETLRESNSSNTLVYYQYDCENAP